MSASKYAKYIGWRTTRQDLELPGRAVPNRIPNYSPKVRRLARLSPLNDDDNKSDRRPYGVARDPAQIEHLSVRIALVRDDDSAVRRQRGVGYGRRTPRQRNTENQRVSSHINPVGDCNGWRQEKKGGQFQGESRAQQDDVAGRP